MAGKRRYITILALWSLVVMANDSLAGDDDPLPWSAPANQQQCPVGPTAVWIDAPAGGACMRFFAAGELDSAPVAVVLLRGDRQLFVGRDPGDIPGNTAADQEKLAMKAMARIGVPVISIARPGTYGSSGDHLRRRQQMEFDAINATLDAIRARYHIGKFALVGHSGGATAVGAMLTYGRQDIGCAIIESGAFDLIERARLLREQNDRKAKPGLDTTGLANPYDPIDHIDGIAADPARKIVVMGDPRDTVTPFSLQQRFANLVRLRGHNVTLSRINARAPAYHNPGPNPSLDMVAQCISRASN